MILLMTYILGNNEIVQVFVKKKGFRKPKIGQIYDKSTKRKKICYFMERFLCFKELLLSTNTIEDLLKPRFPSYKNQSNGLHCK